MRKTKLRPKSKHIAETYLSNEMGKREYVILPIRTYKKMLALLEDYGLAKAIKEAEKDRVYSVEEALKMLSD